MRGAPNHGVLALALAMALGGLGGCGPPKPDESIARAALSAALAEEAAEPYAILAVKLSTGDTGRAQLEELARRLYRIDDVSIQAFEEIRPGLWSGQLTAHIACALPDDANELNRREALAMAMAYRSLCGRGVDTAVRLSERHFELEYRSGIWVASLDPTTATKR